MVTVELRPLVRADNECVGQQAESVTNLVLFNSMLLTVLILMQAIVLRDRDIAVHVARDAAEAGKLAAAAAEKAAFTARLTLDRIEALFLSIEQQGGQTLRATVRMEDADAVVADNLAGAQHRADNAVQHGPIGTIPGAAADAAARSAPEEPSQ